MIVYNPDEQDGVEFVKKEYKGKMEAMKRHQQIENFVTWNQLAVSELEQDEKEVFKLISSRHALLKYLRLVKDEGKFIMGKNLKVSTEFHPLEGMNGEDSSEHNETDP